MRLGRGKVPATAWRAARAPRAEIPWALGARRPPRDGARHPTMSKAMGSWRRSGLLEPLHQRALMCQTRPLRVEVGGEGGRKEEGPGGSAAEDVEDRPAEGMRGVGGERGSASQTSIVLGSSTHQDPGAAAPASDPRMASAKVAGAPLDMWSQGDASGVMGRTIIETSSSPVTAARRSIPSISESVREAAVLLPDQAILENFVHHNPLEKLQYMTFQKAVNDAHLQELYMSPGRRVLSITDADPRHRVHEALVSLCAVFLDRGSAKVAPGFRHRGFLYFFASLEGLGFSQWRWQAREDAYRVLEELRLHRWESREVAEAFVAETLHDLGVASKDRTDTIRSMMLELRGWAGMFNRMETHPEEAPPNTDVRLVDFVAVHAILTRSSIRYMAPQSGWLPGEFPLSEWLNQASQRLDPSHEQQRYSSALSLLDLTVGRREQIETEFEERLLTIIGTRPVPTQTRAPARPQLQLYTCIDDRECSLRRHVEELFLPGEAETFGVPGFFNLPVRYFPENGRQMSILAPEGEKPSAVLIEKSVSDTRRLRPQRHDRLRDLLPDDEGSAFKMRRRLLAKFYSAWEWCAFSPFTSAPLCALFMPFNLGRLQLMGFSPYWYHRLSNAFTTAIVQKPKTDFDMPFQSRVGAELLASTFKNVGTTSPDRFAPLVIILGHGASSVNNPFAAAYNCGACGGRDGAPNARVMARLANDWVVRSLLKSEHDVVVPEDTVFVGGVHNTTTDEVEFFDLEQLPDSHRGAFDHAESSLRTALGRNALERCKKFLLAHDQVKTPEQALRHVFLRSVDWAEIRPELNHATNAAVIIGRRSLSQGRQLDRRVFLPAYDPFLDDDRGSNLETVLAPSLVVCSGINLEYLFSTIDDEHHGAGTKVPLNLVGYIGVMQGTNSDLRAGLPTQMTEMHTPVRALYVVDAPVKRIEAVLARREDLRQLVHNDWVHMVARDPESNKFFKQSGGHFQPVSVEDGEGSPWEAQESSLDSVTALSRTLSAFSAEVSHGMAVSRKEELIYRATMGAMVAACVGPVYLFGATSMSPYGPLIALSATFLALPVLAFSRRYLHGEFMFGRVSALSAGLLLGFNLIATAPTLEAAVAGWSLFGFASTFLIGTYNERPTVRNNATFVFAAYRLSDMAMLAAATYHVASGYPHSHELVAGSLVLAALLKSSQYPLISLFMRSMEGPTPTSALGYAGLSAHVGVVLLASTMPLWYDVELARYALAFVGSSTCLYASSLAQIRADRKGSIANVTSATIGLIFLMLSQGYAELALITSLGHASFRMIQILQATDALEDFQRLRSTLGYQPWPVLVPEGFYRLRWGLRRFEADTQSTLLQLLEMYGRHFGKGQNFELSKMQQWGAVAGITVLAGAPYTPLSHSLDSLMSELLISDPYMGVLLMLGHGAISVFLVRFLFVKILSARRFQESRPRVVPRPPPKTHQHGKSSKKGH